MIKKIPHDTETFKFHNANPKGKRSSDCVIRAISTATGKSWDEVLDDLVKISHKYKEMPNDTKCYAKYLEDLGFSKMKQPRKADNTKYTGSEFCEYLRRIPGEYNVVAHIGGHHIVAIVDYKVVDIWNSTGKTIGNYWIKRK